MRTGGATQAPSPGPGVRAPAGPALAGPWDERVVVAFGGGLAYPYVAVGANDDTAFSLSSVSHGYAGPYRLARVDLSDGSLTQGPLFGYSQLAFDDGYVWVYGNGSAGAAPDLCEVDPQTLRPVRSLRLDAAVASSGAEITSAQRRAAVQARPLVAAGPPGSIWVGLAQLLLRVDVATGRLLESARVGQGNIAAMASDPAGLRLYLSVEGDFVSGRGQVRGSKVIELDATSGRTLATSPGDSFVGVAADGQDLYPTPFGTWVSFRSGAAVATLILRQADLETEAPATGSAAVGGWAYGSSLFYGDGAMWVDTRSTVGSESLECLDPRTGAILAEAPFAPGESSGSVDFLAASAGDGSLYGLSESGFVAVSPPRPCWLAGSGPSAAASVP